MTPTPAPGPSGPAAAPSRRPRRPAAERRRQVLDAARTLFAERGFHATTTRDLAAAADINDALLYRYFPDKQAILAALADEAVAVFQALPAVPDQAPLPLEEFLELVGTAFVKTARANLDLLTILLNERRALPGNTRFAEFIDRSASRLGRLIDETAATRSAEQAATGAPVRAIRAGRPDGPGYLTARTYFGALVSFVLLQDQLGMATVHPVDDAEYIRHLVKLLGSSGERSS